MRDLIDIVSERAVYRPGTVHPLKQVLKDLEKNPLAPYIRIFGEAANTPWNKIPSSIEAFIDLNDTKHFDKDARKQAMADLLRIAQQHYGSFDPYVSMTTRIGTHPTGRPVFEQVLWTCDVHARRWVIAKNKGKMTAAGRAGKPLSSLNQRSEE